MLQPIISHKASCPFAVEFSNEAETSNHFHSELELVFLLNGKLTYILGGRQYSLKAKDFIFSNPYELHSVSLVSDDCSYVRILIQESRLRFLFSTPDTLLFTWQESLNNRAQPLHGEIAAAVRSMVIEGTNQECGYLAKAYQDLMCILLALNRWCRQKPEAGQRAQKPMNQQQKSREIMEYINSHYMEQISLETLSKVLYLSPPYISKIFKDNFQVGVLEYLNRLRVQKSVFPLCHSNAYIADIANECGFPSAKTYSRIFLREMGVSPTEYRRQYAGEEHAEQPSSAPLRSDFAQLLDFEAGPGVGTGSELVVSHPVRYDFTAPPGPGLVQPWNRVLYAGMAELLLRNSVRTAALRAVQDFDIEYIRITGVFSDGLHTYQEDEDGAPRYFWMMLDEVLLFLTRNKLKPFIGLGYMPRQLASVNMPSPFAWDANTSAPKSMKKWENYLRAFLQHLVQLFSYEAVCGWRFEFWSDPVLRGVFWQDSVEAFRPFFLASYRVFRSVLPDGQFGSPGFVPLDGYREAGDFLGFCTGQGVRFDFLCMHLFELTDPRNPGTENMNRFRPGDGSAGHGARFVAGAATAFRAVADRAGCHAPVVITEWNVSPYFHDLSRDTCFMTAYIADTVNRLPACVESISFWSLIDYTGEHLPLQDIFSGELGMRTNNGFAKPSYLTFQLLKRAQGRVLESGEDYFITRSSHGYHIVLYHHCFYAEEFLNGSSRPLSHKDRYQIFAPGSDRRFNLDLTLEPGHYRVERYLLDREHGSIYDAWVRMGAPDFIDSICGAYLDKMACPDCSIHYRDIRGSLLLSEQVPQHGVLLLSLIRLGDAHGEA